MFILQLVSKFIKILNSDASPNQVAWGFALGTILGFTPLMAFHNLIVVVLLIILRVNIASAMLSFALVKLFAWALDPLFHRVGFFVLTDIAALQSFWTSLYNAPIAPFTRFNNTIVMGSLLISLVLLVPNYIWFKWFIRRYRESWNEKVKKWKITKVLLGNKLVQFYFKLKNFGE
ncbi:TIGR03546 family protein [candidate division KSB1 bacterium]|nr:TIGR03546 family protein [candidate division KSB1 bacterium]